MIDNFQIEFAKPLKGKIVALEEKLKELQELSVEITTSYSGPDTHPEYLMTLETIAFR